MEEIRRGTRRREGREGEERECVKRDDMDEGRELKRTPRRDIQVRKQGLKVGTLDEAA